MKRKGETIKKGMKKRWNIWGNGKDGGEKVKQIQKGKVKR